MDSPFYGNCLPARNQIRANDVTSLELQKLPIRKPRLIASGWFVLAKQFTTFTRAHTINTSSRLPFSNSLYFFPFTTLNLTHSTQLQLVHRTPTVASRIALLVSPLRHTSSFILNSKSTSSRQNSRIDRSATRDSIHLRITFTQHIFNLHKHTSTPRQT